MREFADGGGLAGPVHADDKDNARTNILRGAIGVCRDPIQDAEQLLFQRIAQLAGVVQRLLFGGLANQIDHLLRGANAEVGGKQGIFKAANLLGIEAAVAGKDPFHARGDFRMRFGDGFLQPVEERRRRFVIAEKSDHRFRIALQARAAPQCDSNRRQNGLRCRSAVANEVGSWESS